MDNGRSLKLFGLVGGVAILNTIVLSPGILGVEIGGESVLETASGITLLAVSFLVLLYGSYALLFKAPAAAPVKKIVTREDFIAALNHYRNAKGLKKDISLALDQLERIEKKKLTLSEVLSQRFDQTEISYKKFASVIHEVEKLFYLNIRGILNQLSVFDVSGYASFASQQKSAKFSDKLVKEKNDLYNEYLSYVTGYLGANEEILLKLDKLLLEISLLNSADYRDVEEMPCMKEIDLLIKQTKLYKH
ncbi:hypothetical protein [Paenibacillus sp. FJAT-27812]|uniref:hypothetical protein n=1 Tax=Paenibacillus sp. FJAT-27812 TaxID=1684143 RepID=UPI0006A769F5|nr:hypothetical protein [Paenibacillus sp. FJAT-27812]